jgi:hypothetical protein
VGLSLPAGYPDKVVAKGMTLLEKGSAIMNKLSYWGCAISVDASRFDLHVSREVLEIEHTLYKILYACDDKLCRLLKMQLTNKCYGRAMDGQVRYTVEGRRMSGDMNTSLGNILISVFLATSVLVSNGVKGDMLVDGDDVLLFCNPCDNWIAKEIPKTYKELGFRAKVEKPTCVLEDVEFCSARPIRVNHAQAVLVRPYEAMEKDAMTLSASTEKEAQRWAKSVGKAGLRLYSFLPVWTAYYGAYARLACKETRSNQWTDSWYHHMVMEGPNVYAYDETLCRVSFARAFGVQPDLQAALEEYYGTITYGAPCDSAVALGVRVQP